MRIYVIDNYDSFVYNLVHYLKDLGVDEIKVVKNDRADHGEIKRFHKILLSPGPGIPKDAGKMMDVIKSFHHTHPMLGVCLGHQAIGQFFGWRLKRLAEPLHGVASGLNIVDGACLFKNMHGPNAVGHYHSWVVTPVQNTPLVTTATDPHGNVMALRHRNHKVFGVQFHPESLLTENGKTILQNWLQL